MTPGPTEVPERVREAMSRPIQNPDIEEEFFEFYHELEKKLKKVYETDNDILILAGEGMLGLEATIASTIEKGDEILCISNGIFGDGLADLVKKHRGNPTKIEFSNDEEPKVEKIKTVLKKKDYKAATMVHCETPTGTLNNIDPILSILKEENILTLVDAVSSLGGTPVPTDKIDICMGASQKCFSAPPGLTTLSISDRAWDTINETEQRTLYTNLKIWKNMWLEKEQFPYTHSVSNIYGLNEAINIILEKGLKKTFQRHKNVAKLCRKKGKQIGLETHPQKEESNSPTVTAFKTDNNAEKIQNTLKKNHNMLIATSLQNLKNKIIRIGHMGYNAERKKVEKTMNALEKVLQKL